MLDFWFFNKMVFLKHWKARTNVYESQKQDPIGLTISQDKKRLLLQPTGKRNPVFWAFILSQVLHWASLDDPMKLVLLLSHFTTLKTETEVMKLPQGWTVRDKIFWAPKYHTLCRTSQTEIYEHPRQAKHLAHLQNICLMYLKERLSSENIPANPPLGKTKAPTWQTHGLRRQFSNQLCSLDNAFGGLHPPCSSPARDDTKEKFG